MGPEPEKLYIVLVSIHGLIRGHDLELGRDADTGGQTKYVVELARALGELPGVARVDLLTRRLVDDLVSSDYSHQIEPLSKKSRIVRVDCADNIYIPKEDLWDHLDSFADNALYWLQEQDMVPSVIHSHYADAGYVATRLVHQMGIPLVHTGHSLGRSKRKRLLASGLKGDEIEGRYNMSRRIEAEELTLGTAQLVITSTHQEIEEQYGQYDYYRPDQMTVIPPGTDLQQFFPPEGDEKNSGIFGLLSTFLQDPHKPIILALSRPDRRKNISSLIKAYGESRKLQKLANLVIIAGNRDDIRDLDTGAQEVLTEILLTIDTYDLYGKVAYPKHHQPDDVPVMYRLAALSGGVFVNPALTEPFGLTLIEAAASQVPIIATEDGGPFDIIGNCKNGELIDPLDSKSISDAIEKVLTDKSTYKILAKNGLEGVRHHYSWQAHAGKYMEMLQPLLEKTETTPHMKLSRRPMLYHDRAIFTDLDQNLLGNPASLKQFIEVIRGKRKDASFCIATGRRLDSALQILKRYNIPQPDALITSIGTDIHYAPNLTRDTAWREHIDYMWSPRKIRQLLDDMPGLSLQPKNEQGEFKISYYYDPVKAPDTDEINQLLLQNDLSVNMMFSFGQFLDFIPARASKGLALRWYAAQWGIPIEHVLAAGGSGSDEDMMRGNTLAVVVSNRHHEELSELSDIEQIYFTKKPFAEGILDALNYYDFFGTCKPPTI